MSIAGWLVDGPLPSFPSYSAGIQSNAAVYSPFNDYVAIHSPTAASWVDYGMEDVLIVSSPEYGKASVENGALAVDQQVCDTFLPNTPEDTFWSDWEIRQVVPLLQTTQVVHSVGPQYLETQGYTVPSSPHQKCEFFNVSSLSSPWQAVPKAVNEGTALSTDLMTTGSEDIDVMDMLSQLCDTVDGEMIIEQAELTAFDSILPKMSPEDVDSLLSSESPYSEMHVAVSSSSLAVTPPMSPSESISTESSEMSIFVPYGEKKTRKKEQNKTAALRYRQKKRSEHGSVMSECEVLEKRNLELKTKVSDMMKEIDYLKGLIAEIYA